MHARLTADFLSACAAFRAVLRGAATAGEDDEAGMDAEDAPSGAAGARGSVLVDALYARPFGEVLLSYAAVTPYSWAAGETEYGRWAGAEQMWCWQ